jgi:hypothetical protein
MDLKLIPILILAIATFFVVMFFYPLSNADRLQQTLANYQTIAFIDMNTDNALTSKTILSGDDNIIVSGDKNLKKLSDFDDNKDGVIFPDDKNAKKIFIISRDNKFSPAPLFTSGIKAIVLKNIKGKEEHYLLLNDGSIRTLRLPQ